MSDDDNAAQPPPPPPPPRGPGGKPLADAAGGIERAGTTGPAMGSGMATGAGLARDAADLGSSAARGDLGGAAEATTRAGVTAAATYFGGTAGGDAARKALNTGIGKALTGSSRWIVWAVVAAILVPLFMGTAVVAGMISIFGGAAALAACNPNAVGSGSTPLENPTQDQVAGALYAQAMGLGLGEVAALVAIGVGYGETGLQNDTEGDCWYGDCSNGHTSSRGVFQQFYSWPPPGTAWSGTSYGPKSGGTGTDFSGFNASNAWGPQGWATSDPRMNVAQSANMFLLGPDYGATMGLEDNALYQSLKNNDPKSLSSGQLVQIAQQVQQFPPAHMGSYEVNMTQAFEMLERIDRGEVAIPSFTPPLPGMAKSATTAETKQVVEGGGSGGSAPNPSPSASSGSGGGSGSGGSTPSPSSSASPSTNQNVTDDGLLLVGDSLAEGIAVESGVFPDEVFGGPTVIRTQVGITTSAAISKWGEDIKSGPSRVLVSLGTNNYADSNEVFAGQVDRLMGLAGKERAVYWFTMHYSKATHFNAVLQLKAAEYPNLRLVDITEGIQEYLSSDGIHPGADGYAYMWSTAQTLMSGATGTRQGGCGAGGIPATGELQRRALEWALAITGGTYMDNNDWTPDPTSPEPPTWPDYNCSTMTAAAYRYASNDAISLVPLSGEQWLDTTNIQLVPFAEAQPGDIFFEYTGGAGGSDARVGHVGLIVDVNGGDQAIWHACGASSCQSNGNIGIGYSALEHIGTWMTVSDPSRKDDPAERAKFLTTSDRNQAYVGRVIAPNGGASGEGD